MQILEPNVQASAPAPAAPAPPAKGLRKVNFGKLPKKTEETTTAYPVFTDPNPKRVDEIFGIAARIKQRAGQLEALEGAQKTDKAELRMFVTPFYFKVNAGRAKPPSSISIPSAEGEVLVTFQNRYAKMASDESLLVPVLGTMVDKFFRQSFTININGEDLPAGTEQHIVDEITAVMEKYNALAAMEAKEEIKPTPDFHVARLTQLSPEVNIALENICPIVAMIKTKGRGK